MSRSASAPWALALLLLSLGASGCGYRLVGSGSGGLPPHVKAIAVLPFENRTIRPEIEQRVTEEVTRELSQRGPYRTVTTAEGADATLEGAVTSYRTTPVQFTQAGRQSRVEVLVTLSATLRDRASDAVLWSQAGMVFRDQFDVPESGEFTDQESAALSDVARGAAGALVTSMLENF